MFEILRMQLRQMLGGKRKWLVALCLLLPVLLTFAAATSGGLGHLRRELDKERSLAAMVTGPLPASAERLAWAGKDLEFLDGAVRLTKDGLRVHGRAVRPQRAIVISDGFLIVRDGELWIDRSKQPTDQGWSMRSHNRDDEFDAPEFATIGAIFFFLLYPHAICMLLALFYGTSVLGDELDGKTLTYLFTRPLPRWRFVVGKYLGIVTALLVPTAASLLCAWLIAGSPGGWPVFAGILAGTVAALLAYNALFVLFGFVIPRRAMIVALLYGVFLETILSFVPALVNELTITYYLRSLVVAMLEIKLPPEVVRVVGGASMPVALGVLAGISVGALALSSWLAGRREYVVKDTA